MQALATKYRPSSFDEVVEQSEIKIILQNQLNNNDIRNAYLFVGGAGTGKTTTARIFANEINKGQGSPIELDAASHNSVDDVREIIQDAKTQSLDSEYRIYILDEVHSLSNNAWQAMLKLLEEPPAKSVFIMCTTNPEKIPNTILSRVQRYDFRRISQQGIVDRLAHILSEENLGGDTKEQCDTIENAISYIAKVADGGMRDAITMLDKCLAYSQELTVENVVKALGLADYDVMFELSSAILNKDSQKVLETINTLYADGKDLKTFIRTFTDFVLDICKYEVTQSYDFIKIPKHYDLSEAYSIGSKDYAYFHRLLDALVQLNERLRWDSTPKSTIESVLLLECFRGADE